MRAGALGEDAGLGAGHRVSPPRRLGLLVGGQRRARAHEVAVAVRAVDPAHRRPVLVGPRAPTPGRVRGLLAGVRRASHSSVTTSAAGCGARRAAGCPRPVHSPASTAPDLVADRDHRVAEPVELGEVLRLGRLDHQRARHRERHRRRVEAVVDQPLGDVVGGDAGGLRDRAQVEDALVRHDARRARCRAPGSAAAAACAT